jgi:hypothetical protein
MSISYVNTLCTYWLTIDWYLQKTDPTSRQRGQTLAGLRWRRLAATVNYRPVLSSERALYMKNKESNCHWNKCNIWSPAPRGARRQDDLADWLTLASCPSWSRWPDVTFISVTITFFIFHVERPLWLEDGSVNCSSMTRVQFQVTLRPTVCRPVLLGAGRFNFFVLQLLRLLGVGLPHSYPPWAEWSSPKSKWKVKVKSQSHVSTGQKF